MMLGGTSQMYDPLCETSLSEATKVPENILKGYHFLSSNYPSGDKKGELVYFIRNIYP